jgi:hypothetical protein
MASLGEGSLGAASLLRGGGRGGRSISLAEAPSQCHPASNLLEGMSGDKQKGEVERTQGSGSGQHQRAHLPQLRGAEGLLWDRVSEALDS